MKANFTRKEFALALACALAFGLLSEAASAQVTSGLGPAPLWNAKCHGEITPAAPLPIYEKVAFDASVLFDSDKSAL